MFQNDDIELSQSFYKKAVEFMENNTLAPTPVNYTVAYVAATMRNGALMKEFVSKSQSGKPFDNDVMEDLFDRHIANKDELNEKFISPFDSLVKNTLDKMTEQSNSEKETAENYASFTKQLSESPESLDLAKITESLFQITEKSYKEHLTLSEALVKATNEIKTLKSQVQQVKQESNTDPLTDLLNRRGFSEYLNTLESSSEHSCLVIDIDHFKSFNDTYGHYMGDRVLQRVAREIKNNIRGKDIAVRLGGEEFLVVLLNTPVQGAKNVAEKIRESIAKLKLVEKKSKQALPEINISLGASSPTEKEEWDVAIERADKALYHAKNNGRNQTVASVYNPSTNTFDFEKVS